MSQKYYTKQELLELWSQFGDVPINDNDEIQEPFMDYEKGTDRFEIWGWFDERYPQGVYQLMNDFAMR